MFNFFKTNKKLLIGAGAVASVAIAYYYFTNQSEPISKPRPSWNSRWKKFRENNELAPWENTYPNREMRYLSYFNNDSDRDTFNVFVPLCGASFDMIHIAEYFTKSTKKQVTIIGLEISTNAIEYFFESKDRLNQKDYIVETNGNIKIYRSKDGIYEFYVACFFNKNVQKLILQKLAKIGFIDLIYDRAALNCIKPQQRSEYIVFLNKVLNNDGKIFLSTLRFDKSEGKKQYLNRSPYSWSNNEVYDGFKQIINNDKDQIQLLKSIQWSESEYDDEKSLGKRMGIDPKNGFCDIYCINSKI